MGLNIYKTINEKDWDNISVFDNYNGATTDAQLIVVDGATDEQLKFVEAVCDNSDIYEWVYADSIYVDYEDNCAYSINYGESDVILNDCEFLGRRRFENKELSFEDISELYINVDDKALPSWLNPSDDWEERSCDYANDWYGNNDQPSEILQKLNDKGLNVIFQISSVHQFGVNFCVWTKEVNDDN